jgi:Aromatic-ring-opening dioxygenase LigAB, LigA subunit
VGVSLYQVQKLLFHVNRDPQVRARFLDERERLVRDYELTADERRAILETDFHALYRMWITVAAAAGDARGSLLAYQPVPAWSTGCAVAALEPR